MDRVIVAFEGEKSLGKVKELLESCGHMDCVACLSPDQVKRTVAMQRVGAVVCGYKFPGCSAQELFQDLPDYCAMLVMAPEGLLGLIEDPDIFTLRLPAPKSEILASVRMLIQIEGRLERLRKPHRDKRDQAAIDQAKDLLISRRGFTEAQAHRYLQRRSMDSGQSMSRTAHIVIGELTDF